MKAKREHRVPLCGRAVEILEALRGSSATAAARSCSLARVGIRSR